MSRQDWLLLALDSAPGGRLSPVQTQKVLFLVDREARGLVGEGFYNFVPYDYGPFDSDVYADVEQLRREGLVSYEKSPGQRWASYAITEAGRARAREVAPWLNPSAVDYLKRAVSWAASVSFTGLLRAIYAKYPDYAVNSVFRR